MNSFEYLFLEDADGQLKKALGIPVGYGTSA
jgi:hypothetical protein